MTPVDGLSPGDLIIRILLIHIIKDYAYIYIYCIYIYILYIYIYTVYMYAYHNIFPVDYCKTFLVD